jgi:hypothetical protein
VIRTCGSGDPIRLATSAQEVVWSVDHELPILRFSTLHDVVEASLNVRRASLILAGGFALLAVLLSLTGIYGVLSYPSCCAFPNWEYARRAGSLDPLIALRCD